MIREYQKLTLHYTPRGRRGIGDPRKIREAEPGAGILPMVNVKLSL